MAAEQQLEHFRRQAKRYCYDDGFVEIGMGVIFLIVALGLALIFSLDKSYVWLVGLAMILVVFGASFAASRIISDLKERITYMRTGYVENKDQKSLAKWVEIVAALSLIVAALVLPDSLNPMAIINGMGLAYFALIVGYRIESKQLYAVAGLALGLGVLLGITDVPEVLGSIGPVLGTGLALTILGGLQLRHYLQTHPEEVV